MPKTQLLSILVLLALSGCANSPWSKSLEESLSADPQLQTSPSPSPASIDRPSETEVTLPEDFPADFPQYSEVNLVAVETDRDRVRTRWTSSDPANIIVQFYRSQLQDNGWELVNPDPDNDRSPLTARRNEQTVTVSVRPNPNPNEGETELLVEYTTPDEITAVRPTPTPTTESSKSSDPKPETTPQPDTSPTAFSDLDSASEPLRPYVEDLARLGVLTAEPADSTTFAPNRPVTRRQYARWLLETHNRLYADEPAQQLRLVTSSNTPAFQDLPASDPDFPIVQGLTEAGIVPSPLSGADTVVRFRPDEPLSREDLLRWKVPLDLRRALPTATLDAVKETWGFQDTSRVTPDALPALLSDFQNGDRSIVRRAFGYTTLFQPQKAVTRAEAAASLWSFGYQSESRTVEEISQTAN